jgi:hypothetical protein
MQKKFAGFGILAGILIMVLSGCASVPLASEDQDMKAKAMSAPPDKALVYLYRNEVMGSAIKLNVSLDGKLAGQTAAKTYFMWMLNPGSHEVATMADNTSTVQVDAKAGESYYIWQEVKMGMWGPGTKLQLVDKETGKKGVGECKLIQNQ